ncbi:hypothetical protein QFW96_10770 [Saccharopolyspora sp. TS4A08]|uniref:Uncharacterized protein n=1 Tax=Saccharopolyspora ipomoeae TaxID=3042027 RepID=A0ABT6PNT4_9PSEU|nr:hypothetical protein [Saccharopolyspora sp. TS4A08]MDI2029096.1 hypothetical protein [Saccharopolyspora sp. TS4A08]
MPDPYHVQVPTEDLADLTRALELLDSRADLNDRYRAMLQESLALLTQPQIRLTQARGLAKRLMVLIKAAGPDFPDALDETSRNTLTAGRSKADDLVFHPEET